MRGYCVWLIAKTLISCHSSAMAEKKQATKRQQKGTASRIRVKPELPGGFRDYGPADAIGRAQMIETIRKTFEVFGFDPLETSSIQRTEVLTGGEEDSGKIIFNVKGSQEKKSDTSLRFDLTVPLARFIAANPDIPKPFKRYQIGTVWRGERPQAGRYREFMQADVDIVGSSAIEADAEIVAVIYQTLKNLGIDNFLIKINSRDLLNTLPEYANFPPKKLWDVLRIIDKKDKIGLENVIKEIWTLFGDRLIADKVGRFLLTSSSGRVSKDMVLNENAWADLVQIIDDVDIGTNNLEIDLSIVRGLEYYTGAIFETILTDAPEMGSIFSGGRYDNLVSQFTGQNIPAVGASIGVDRLFAALEKLGKLGNQKTNTQVLIFQLDNALKSDYLGIAQELREAGINTALYLGDDQTFQAQLSYAVKKEIPFVVIYGEEEKKKGMVAVKNLATREQKEVSRERLLDFFKK